MITMPWYGLMLIMLLCVLIGVLGMLVVFVWKDEWK